MIAPARSISACFCTLLFLAGLQQLGAAANGTVRISGELKQWHTVTLDIAGPFARETDSSPNPFTDYRLDVAFTHESGAPSYVVPGYFAADGRAGETGAEAGNVWRAHLSPDKPGRWTYRASFTHGPGAALDGGGAALAPYDGRSGSFEVAPTDKTGRDFRAKGRLQYVGGHHLRFGGSGEYFLKAGPDSPETFFGSADFDNTIAGKPAVPLKTWAPHVRDWREGDPTWRGGRGKALIGALNYLASKGLNSFSFLPYNAGGDGDNVWPFVARDDKLHYDCSKLDQWEIVFAHAQRRGLYLHFKLQETEIDDQRRSREREAIVVPEALDGGALGSERKLYLRELIARFGHHLALNWNLGEENTQTPEEQRAMAQFIADTDPYGHLRVIHTYPNEQERVYEPLLGSQSALTGASLQNAWNDTHRRTHQWVAASARAGKPWVVANDEQGSASSGVPPDPGYRRFDGIVTEEGRPPYDLHGIRRYTLWGNLMAGGAGVEYYFGYKLPENDLVAEDFRSRDGTWEYCRIALEFFDRENIPFWKMKNADELVGNSSHDNSRYCLALPGELYLVYLPQGGEAKLDLAGASGAFSVSWFNPREGGALRSGPQISGGAAATLTAPDTEDWLAVVRPAHKSLAVGPTPESVARGFDGKLYVTLMGTVRKPGDGDGKIVVVDGDKVADFATGLDDPKGIVFVDGRLITTDFDKVWAFDAQGKRTLLAGPDVFPTPPRFLNDVAVEAGGRSILVTDMGDLPSMSSPAGVFWPLDSDEAKKRQPFGRVYRITLDGKVSVAIDHHPAMPNPNGVDALEDGRILVAEFFRGTLLESNAGRFREITSGHRSGDGIVHDAAGNLYLTEVRTGHVWHIRVANGEKRLLATLQSAADLILDEGDGPAQLIVPDSKAGQLVFIPVAAAESSPGFSFRAINDKSLGLWEDGTPVLVFNHGVIRRDGVRETDERSGYFHPIHGLDGEVLTDDFPEDHVHHRGLYWAWPHVKVGEKEYSLWELQDIRLDFKRWLAMKTGPTGAELSIEQVWVADGDRPVMQEKIRLHVHTASPSGRAIDVQVTWTPLDRPVTLWGAEGKSYGGTTLRFAPRTAPVITLPTGRSTEDTVLMRFPWADYSGTFAGASGPSGVTIFVHPQHPDHPPEWMTRHYGVLAVGWPGSTPRTFDPGVPVTVRHRLWIHRGIPDAAELQKAYDEIRALNPLDAGNRLGSDPASFDF